MSFSQAPSRTGCGCSGWRLVHPVPVLRRQRAAQGRQGRDEMLEHVPASWKIIQHMHVKFTCRA